MDGRRVARVKIERILPILSAEAKSASASGTGAANNSNGANASATTPELSPAADALKTHPDPAARTR
jgi:hypothetical protein